jgi:hypothetical protein
VISPDQRTQTAPPVEADWTSSGKDEPRPAAKEVLAFTSGEPSDRTYVFELNGDLDPAGCTP